MSASNARRFLYTLAAVMALGCSTFGAEPARADAPSTRLTGTWQVTRTCTSGCAGSTVLTEHVSPYRNGVYSATGDVSQLLYPISSRHVLTHAAKSSSLLTVTVPGDTMRGRGVADDGSTFTVVWSCISSSSHKKDSDWFTLRPMGRAIC